MSIELTQIPLLSVSEIATLASQLDTIHTKALKAIERLNKDIATRKSEIANRWKNAAISAEDQARYAQSETRASVLQIRDNAQAELNSILKSAGAPHEQLVTQRQFWSSPVQVLARAGLGTPERSHYVTQLQHAGPSELAHFAQVAVSTKNEALAAAVLGLLDRVPTKNRAVNAQHLANAMRLESYAKVTEYIKLGDARIQGIILAVRAFNSGRANPLDSLSLALRERAIEKSIIEEGTMRSPIPKLSAYPADHPFAIALAAIARAVRTGTGVVRALDEQARTANVLPGSETYDDAAELAGFPYCRELDLYVPRETRDRVAKRHFTEAHLALA